MKEEKLVYIIQSSNYFKVGVSKNVQNRLKTFQSTLMPYDFNLIATVKDEDCYALESAIHTELKEFRVAGEWFLITEDKLMGIIRDYNFSIDNAPNFDYSKESEINEKIKEMENKYEDSINEKSKEATKKLAEARMLSAGFDKAKEMIMEKFRGNFSTRYTVSQTSDPVFTHEDITREYNRRFIDNNKD